jgi:hypothetical protein
MSPFKTVLVKQNGELAKGLQEIVVDIGIDLPIPAGITPGAIFLLSLEYGLGGWQGPEAIHGPGLIMQ